jgi:hypothetical protein
MTIQPDFHRADSLPFTAAELQVIRRQVEHLHRCGPRPLLEFLIELAAEIGPRRAKFLKARLEVYAAIDPDVVEALCGTEIPKVPLRVVK